MSTFINGNMKALPNIRRCHIAICTVLTVLLSLLGSCRDDLLYDNYEKDGLVRMKIAFEPLTATSLNTRAAGNAIKNIENFAIIFFDRDGKLVKIVNQGDEEMENLAIDQTGNTSMPSGTPAGTDQAEAMTPEATFTLKNIPDGKYRVYAVANIGKVTEEMAATEAELKDRLYKWDETNVAKNNQMFGYLTQSDDVTTNGGFDAPVITVQQNSASLSGWMRRLASKVTIAFNTKGLKNDVWVYINKVTIKDIPMYCPLGRSNSPHSKDSLISNGGVFYYNNQGLVTETDGYTQSTNHNDWLVMTNSDRESVGSDHSETAPALFFYENMQGDYENSPDKQKYDKRMSDNPKDLGILVDPGQPDWKDNVEYGTWVEVEAYYDSRNPENVTSGKIIYRFMLGKNTTYNYNSERNHHFKLTLFLSGWANQADWHIEYTEEDPGILVPPIFYMPYLYNQNTNFPFKLNGTAVSCKVEIIENGWAPYDYKAQKVPSTSEYTWNKAAYDRFGPEDYPQLGFLALAVPNATGQPAKNIIDLDFNNQPAAFNQLKDYYEAEYTDSEGYKYSQKERYLSVKPGEHLKGENNEYSVSLADAGQSLNYQIRFWTRNKQMISNSGFSGNNPYEFYQRKAVVRITAVFQVSPTQQKEIVKEVPVYQVRRLVNPKAIWRSYYDNDEFYVHLMQLDAPNSAKYSPVVSEGSWVATIESGDKTFCYLSTSKGGAEESVIHGDTDSEIMFYVNFRGTVASGTTKGCIINVSYHGNECTHKILVRQGYNTPVEIIPGGAKWSSFNLYACEEGLDDQSLSSSVPALVTVNPLAIGSLFKRRNYSHAILTLNNDKYGPLVPLNGGKLTYGYLKKGADEITKGEATWDEIKYYQPGVSAGDTIYKWAPFTIKNIRDVNEGDRVYRVPHYDDYRALDAAEYAVGIIYADGALRVRQEFEDAQGFEDQTNTQIRSDLGVRAMIVYNRSTGNQICFPLGKYGMGRRTQFNTNGTANYGYLRYADVYAPLTQASNANNIYRPIPYNMPECPGAIYWINCIKINGHESGRNHCLGWDMNYFSLDFSAYVTNNRYDACPVKLILSK